MRQKTLPGVDEVEEEKPKRESNKRFCFEGLTFGPIFEDMFTTFLIRPNGCHDDYGEMLIDPETVNRFKIRYPQKSWKLYDIGRNELQEVKNTVHDMYRANDYRRILSHSEIRRRSQSVLIIEGAVRLKDDSDVFVCLRHIYVIHARTLIRSQRLNHKEQWVKVTKYDSSPRVLASRKRVSSDCSRFLEKKAKFEEESRENKQLILALPDDGYDEAAEY